MLSDEAVEELTSCFQYWNLETCKRLSGFDPAVLEGPAEFFDDDSDSDTRPDSDFDDDVCSAFADLDISAVEAPAMGNCNQAVVRCVCCNNCHWSCHKSILALDSRREKMAALYRSSPLQFRQTAQAFIFLCHEEAMSSRDAQTADRHSFDWHLPGIPGRICRGAFIYGLYLGQKMLRTLKKWVVNYDMMTYQHGNSGIARQQPLYADLRYTDAINFIKELVTDYCIVLPWRVNKIVTHAFPPTLTITEIHRRYVEACHIVRGDEYPPFCRSSLFLLLKATCPNVTYSLVRTDVCDTCHRHTYLMQRTVNNGPSALEAKLAELTAHMELARYHRECYNNDIEHYTGAVKCWDTSTVVICFDYAQNVTVPHHHDCPGRIYFKTPLRIGIFGIYSTSSEDMTTFFLSEDITASYGKGANATISMLHHFLEDLWLTSPTDSSVRKRPEHIIIWCDNCGGQNKNNMFMQYCAWQVANNYTGIVDITVKFMLAGHTKFVCDRLFGIGKRAWHREAADTPEEAIDVWRRASPYIKVVDATTVAFRDWQGMYSACKDIPAIKKQHRFIFKAEWPWEVETSTDGKEAFKRHIIATAANRAALNTPFETVPLLVYKALSSERRWYLYKDVRPFVKECNHNHPIWSKPEEPYTPFVSYKQQAVHLNAEVTQLRGESSAMAKSGSGNGKRGRPAASNGNVTSAPSRKRLSLPSGTSEAAFSAAAQSPTPSHGDTLDEEFIMRAHGARGGSSAHFTRSKTKRPCDP
jgi:hypothetical protein